jgi:hypothetical protein
MRLEIRSFAEAGNHPKERITLQALGDIDIGDYAVFYSGVSRSGDAPTSGRKSAYWFPDREVKGGDLVVLYTKKGSSSKKPLSGGRTAHFFYWGKDNALWGDREHCAVLLSIAEWDSRVSGQ